MWPDKVVDILRLASIISAAGFAALGLFTEYKDKDGKITPPGRVAVIGIFLSAILSLGTQWGQDELDRLKAARQADRERQAEGAERERFRAQMDQFAGIARQQGNALVETRSLNRQMRRSLQLQQGLQTQIGGTLAAVHHLRVQDSSNTIRVLRGLWDDANRIEDARVEVHTIARCDLPDPQPTPALFRDSRAFLRVYTRQEIAALAAGNGPQGWEALGFAQARLLASRQSESDEDFSGLEADYVRTRYHGFVALHPHLISDPEIWRSGQLRLSLLGRLPSEHGAIDWPAVDPDLLTTDLEASEIRQQFIVTEFGTSLVARGMQVERYLPCTVVPAIVVNGRSVLHRPRYARVAILRAPNGDRMVGAEFPMMVINNDSIPAFLLGRGQ